MEEKLKGVDLAYPAADGSTKHLESDDNGEIAAQDVQPGEKRKFTFSIGDQKFEFETTIKASEELKILAAFADTVARAEIAKRMPFPASKPVTRMLLTIDENNAVGMTEQTGNIATFEYQFKLKKGKSVSFNNPAFKGYTIDPTILAETTAGTNFYRVCRMGRIKEGADFDVFFGNDNQVNVDSNYVDDVGEQDCNVKLILQVVKATIQNLP